MRFVKKKLILNIKRIEFEDTLEKLIFAFLIFIFSLGFGVVMIYFDRDGGIDNKHQVLITVHETYTTENITDNTSEKGTFHRKEETTTSASLKITKVPFNPSDVSNLVKKASILEAQIEVLWLYDTKIGKCYNFGISLKNISDKPVSDWFIVLNFSKNVELLDCVNVMYDSVNNHVILHCRDYNTYIPSQGNVYNLSAMVQYDEETTKSSLDTSFDLTYLESYSIYVENQLYTVKYKVEGDNKIQEETTTIEQTTENNKIVPLYGALQVVNNNLCGQNGNPVIIKGISTHNICDSSLNIQSFLSKKMFSSINHMFNNEIVRLAIYTEGSKGYLNYTNTEKAIFDRYIDYAINAAISTKQYIIIDWHIMYDDGPLLDITDDSIKFFNNLSKKYGSYDNIIYEIANEPSGTWEEIKEYSTKVISAIRENDPDGIILVPTPSWCQDVDIASISPLDEKYSNNILYTLHFFAGSVEHQDNLQAKYITAVNNGLPVFVSEFGISENTGTGKLDIDAGNTWIDLLKSNKTSFVIWNLSKKEESSALLNASYVIGNEINYSDLSAEGIWFQKINTN